VSDMNATAHPVDALEATAARVAELLQGTGAGLWDPTSGDLSFETVIEVRPLRPTAPPAVTWAVDGGQALVADARCIQVLATRAARVCFRDGACVVEEEGDLRTHVVGGLEQRASLLAGLELPGLTSDTSVDVNLLRDRWEWEAVERSVAESRPGTLVLVDGDLQPDWRIPSTYLAGILAAASARGVLLAGVVKHSSLSRGGAPLLGQLEREAAALLGERATWWAPVARTRPDVEPGIQVVAARLDPDARFAFRVDLPADVDPEPALAGIAGLCDDAAFPGYPYPLSVADRLAACPGWLRADLRIQLDQLVERAGVPAEVVERAFTDRHRLMERA
jgi:hypothetical protein